MGGGYHSPTSSSQPSKPPPPVETTNQPLLVEQTDDGFTDEEIIQALDQFEMNQEPMVEEDQFHDEEEGYITDPGEEYNQGYVEEVNPPLKVQPVNPQAGELETDPYDFDEDWWFKHACKKHRRQQLREEGWVSDIDSSDTGDDSD